MRNGVIQMNNSAGALTAYNLNPFPVTVNGTTYQPAQLRRPDLAIRVDWC